MTVKATSDLWWKDAIVYCLDVETFLDWDGDGSGDLHGLTERVDYLAGLGISCLWLMPFYPSPNVDDGYDITDFYAIDPRFGSFGDFTELIRTCRDRGIRVIAEFVMNHTSDQHPWFQESRRDLEGPYGDYYVWSDDETRFPDARIIFVDTESSNWTWDPLREQYYWHRFFSHQPDLNYENPEVQEAMLEVLRFWLDLGIDGFRLDAIP